MNRQVRFFGNVREVGKEMGVLGGPRGGPPNTPCFLPHYANSQRTTSEVQLA